MKKILLLLQLFIILIPIHPIGQGEKEEQETLSVFVSILPQVYFVERIGGNRVTVQELVPAGREPHVYEPTPRQMASLSHADVYFTIGVPFEKVFLPKLHESIKNVKIVDTTKGINFRYFKTHDPHDHDDQEDHEAGVRDPHIWLGTKEVTIQLKHILEALCAIDPDGKNIYESQYKQFISEIESLHDRTNIALMPVKGEKFFVFHPAFGYFADEYGLEQFPIEIEGKDPGARQLARIIEMVTKENVQVIFVQPQFSQENAKTIAEHTGCVVVPIDPLNKDWLRNLKDVSQKIEEGLKS